MSSRHNDGVAAADKQLFDRFGHRGITNSRIEYVFDLRVATRQSIAYDDKVWLLRLDVFSSIPFVNGNPQTIEEVRHRRINVCVGAANQMLLLTQHSSQR